MAGKKGGRRVKDKTGDREAEMDLQKL